MKIRILIAALITLCIVIILCSLITMFAGAIEYIHAQCVDFEDPPLGAMYYVGDSFFTEGVLISARRFLWPSGEWYYDGYAQVEMNGLACQAGQEIWTNNINIAFDFNAPISNLTLYYGAYGGYLNIEVNGALQHFGNMLDIHGTTIGGAYVTASAGQGCGVLTLSGTINSFFIGGQEFCIDHACFEEAVEDSCVDFEDVPSALTYSVGSSFSSEGAVITVRQFQYEGGTWTTSGETDVSTAGFACHTGQEMRVNNVNLEVNFGHAVDGLSLYCGDLGGNDNIQINGDFLNVPDITDLHGVNLGGVDLSVANGPGHNCWIVTFTGIVHVFYIGGQEFFLDHICPGDAVEDDCIDFEDVPLITPYYTGTSFESEGFTIEVKDFQWSNLQWTNNGYAQAGADLMACHLGHEMWTNNVNLEFIFVNDWPGLSLYYGEYGGNLNIDVNGDFRNFDKFVDIDGQNIGGAAVTVFGGQGQGCGFLLLNGTIQTFSIGGQELWLDHVCPEEAAVEDSCVDFEDLTPPTTYPYGASFASEGALIDVEQFQLEGGTWTTSGYTEVRSFGEACHLGYDMMVNNVNLAFDFGTSWPGLSLYYGNYGGNLNVEVNGDFWNFDAFIDIHGAVIGGVPIIVSGIVGSECGELLLAGEVNSFAIGGQELFIDHICPVDVNEDGACCLEDGGCASTDAGLCNILGGTYLGDGSVCLGDANTNGIDDACEFDCAKGDCNCDGVINILDVLCVANDILDIIPITDPEGQWLADCNGDNVINILDALGIANVILGWGTCGPGACKSTVTPETMEFIESLRPYLEDEIYHSLIALIKTEVGLPTEYGLAQNYPNPFNPTTEISYQIPDVSSPLTSSVCLKIYNSLGQEVRTLVEKVQAPGYYTVTWDGKSNNGRQAASGVYFYRLTVGGTSRENRGDFTATKRMILMK